MQKESKVPVFVFPHKLIFVLQDKNTHKQIITLHNPYGFSVRYKVLATSPKKYTIGNPEGVVLSQHRVDIVVRHNEIDSSTCDVADKFRIQLYDNNTNMILGKRDIQSILKSHVVYAEKQTSDIDKFEHMPPSDEYKQGALQSPIIMSEMEVGGNGASSSPNYVILTIAGICMIGLFVPTEKEDTSFFGLHISFTLKLIFSYILGLVTSVILKS